MNAGKLWPVAIAGVLGVTVLANVWLLWSASDENAAVVEPDYYRKALNYDSTMAQQRTNIALDWQVEVESRPVTREGNSELRVRVVDAQGAPLTGATVGVTAIHNLTAAQRPQARLAETADGVYTGSIMLRRPGFWEFRVAVVRGDDRFTHRLQRDVFFDRGAGSPEDS